MAATITLPCAGIGHDPAHAPDEEVRRHVWMLLSGLYPPARTLERRSEQRFAFPHLLYLTPTDDHLGAVNESVVVIGKHLSERGLGFFHQLPLPHRHMIASLEARDGRWLAFLVDIHWCRFTQHGWYDSGGRLLQVVTSPLET